MKRCTKCGKEYPPTPEFFFRHSRGEYGLRPDCKSCTYKQSNAWRAANRDKVRQYARDAHLRNPGKQKPYQPTPRSLDRLTLRAIGMKRCIECNQVFADTAENFARDRTRPNGLAPRCKSCNREIATRYRRLATR